MQVVTAVPTVVGQAGDACLGSDARFAGLEQLGCEPAERARARRLLQALPEATASQAVRFLRARDGDVDAAQEFLEQHLRWRQETLPVPVEEARVELDRLKYTPLGRMPDGQYVITIRSRLMGKHTYNDMREVERGLAYLFDFVETNIIGPLEKIVVLYSRVDSTRSALDPAWIKFVAGMLQNNYPERLVQCHVAPVPFLVRGVWETIKLLLDPVTRGKVVLWGDIASFGSIVPLSHLPVEFGGEDANATFSIEPWLRPVEATIAVTEATELS